MAISVRNSDDTIEIELACEAAYLCLLDSLACAFQSLQHTECTRLLGPLVPGATMTFGARVPGTSFQLDPVQAAFNLGAMIGWLDQRDAVFTTRSGHLADTLGALLTVGDYQARKNLAEARAPATVRDLFIQLLDAEQRGVQQGPSSEATPHCCDAVRAAGAISIASLLGATPQQITRVIALAQREVGAIGADTRPPWWLGDANARGVRIALLAVNEAPERAEANQSAQPPGTPPVAALDLRRCWGVPTALLSALDAPAASRVRDRFTASITAHFPPVQAEKIRVTFMDRARLESLPINELVSLTVRN